MTDIERSILSKALQVIAKYKKRAASVQEIDQHQGKVLLDKLEAEIQKLDDVQLPSKLERDIIELYIKECNGLLDPTSYEFKYLSDLESIYLDKVVSRMS